MRLAGGQSSRVILLRRKQRQGKDGGNLFTQNHRLSEVKAIWIGPPGALQSNPGLITVEHWKVQETSSKCRVTGDHLPSYKRRSCRKSLAADTSCEVRVISPPFHLSIHDLCRDFDNTWSGGG